MDILSVKNGIKAYLQVVLLGKMPVIVYAVGRVGSVSMLNALRRAGVVSFKVESFDNTILTSSRFCKRYVLGGTKTAKFILLIRDPAEVLISLYFSKLMRQHISAQISVLEKNDIEKLISLFHTEILESSYIPTYLYWFENEFRRHIGFDMFEKPFDATKKYVSFREGRFEFLIIRIDLLDLEKENQVKNFLRIDNFALKRENDKTTGEYSALYSQFKRELKIIPEKLDMIYNSAYARHFFNEEEIAVMRRRWS
jgi:hypothetical protein